MSIDVKGQSGKMTIGFGDEKAVMVTFDAVTELDASGNAVGTSGSTKHSFNSFASQDFTIGDHMEGVCYEDAEGVDLRANLIKFEATGLADVARLFVDTYFFLDSGTIDNGGEVTTIEPYMFKWNIGVEDWPFCGSEGVSCKKGSKNEVGEMLDVDIEIKGLGVNPTLVSENAGEPIVYDLGGGALLSLSKKIEIDGSAIVDMATGYPKVITKGSKTLFTFRFPKAQSILYDPAVDFGVVPDTESPTIAPTIAPTNAPTITDTIAPTIAPTEDPADSNNDDEKDPDDDEEDPDEEEVVAGGGAAETGAGLSILALSAVLGVVAMA